MPHATPLDESQMEPEARAALHALADRYGQMLNLHATLARQPDVLNGVAKIEAGIDRDLPPALRELARYKASQINECKYSADCRRTAALRAGISERQLEAIDDYVRDGMFSDQQKAVLAYAEQLTRTANVEPTIVKKLKRFLNERQLVTLAAAVALTNFTDRVTHGLDVESP